MPKLSVYVRISFISDNSHTGLHGHFKCGDNVLHARYGLGRVLKAWGHWKSEDPIDGKLLDVSGANIYEIQFDDGIHSANVSTLTLIEPATLSPHPFTKNFPKLPDEDFAALKASIQAHGQFEPIVINASGQILDGLNRSQICKELGIEPRTVQFSELSVKSSEERFIFDVNLRRRHLPPAQRAVLALALLPLIREESKARQEAARLKGLRTQSERRSKGKTQQDGRTPTTPLESRVERQTDKILARRAGVGLPTMKAVIAAHDHHPELLGQLRNGSLSASAAMKLIKPGTNGSKPKEVSPDTALEVVAAFKKFVQQSARKYHLSVANIRQHVVEHLRAVGAV